MAKRALQAESSDVVIYCRVSTGRQADRGVSLDAQEAECRAYAARQGLRVVAVHVDAGLSGKRAPERRPGLAAVIASGLPVVVYSLSRLGRSQRMIWGLLDEHGPHRLRVSSATEPFDTRTPMGRAFLGMLATFAQLESDLASERTADALAYVGAQGVQLGGAALGWAHDSEELDAEGRRVIRHVEAETATVARIVALSGEGRSLRAIAAALTAEGHATKRGGRWQANTVAKVLARVAAA